MSDTKNEIVGSERVLIVDLSDSAGRKKCPEGTWTAVVDEVHDLGVQPGQKIEDSPRRRFTFAFHTSIEQEGRSEDFILFRTVNQSGYAKSQMMETANALLGRTSGTSIDWSKFNIYSLVGRSCMVVVRHKLNSQGKLSANIEQAIPLPQGLKGLPRNPKYAEPTQFILDKVAARLDKPKDPPSEFIEIENFVKPAAEKPGTPSVKQVAELLHPDLGF